MRNKDLARLGRPQKSKSPYEAKIEPGEKGYGVLFFVPIFILASILLYQFQLGYLDMESDFVFLAHSMACGENCRNRGLTEFCGILRGSASLLRGRGLPRHTGYFLHGLFQRKHHIHVCGDSYVLGREFRGRGWGLRHRCHGPHRPRSGYPNILLGVNRGVRQLAERASAGIG